MLINRSEFKLCVSAAEQKSGCMFDKTIGKWSVTVEGQFRYGLITTVTYENGKWKDFVVKSHITFDKFSNVINKLQERIINENMKKGASC